MKFTLIVLFLCLCYAPSFPQSINKTDEKYGTVVDEHLVSSILKENRIGLDPNRLVKVYLPPGYNKSNKSYPVVYYLHSIGSNPDKLFDDNKITQTLERAVSNSVINEFIFVSADYSSPTIGSLFENSPVSGRWLDFTVNELIPFIDRKFRTLRHRNSRAVAGDFIGGRGALKLAMNHAETFSVVYALHPVATGMGYMPWADLQLDWKKISQAKTFGEIGTDFRSRFFVAVSQAFLPNMDRPPFYCDFLREEVNGEFKTNLNNLAKAKAGFHLEETLHEAAGNLRAMRGIAFDWGRFDSNQDHVYANQALSKKLREEGIEHEAEEYNADPFSKNWTEYGRVYTRMLPFFMKHLVFEEQK